MATGAISSESSLPSDNSIEMAAWAQAILRPIASLKLTVVLFALSIFIIFVGTLAQVDMDMWEVIEVYFRSTIAWIDFQVFFPRSWFPSLADKVPGSFPMPGGFLIGVLMALNLVAAHLVRFKIQAKGPELLLGLVVMAIGSLVTWWVIASGHNQSGLQGEPPFSWETLWYVVRAGLILTAVASGIGMAMSPNASTRAWLLGLAIIGGGFAAWACTTIPSPSSLRILWQLIQGGLAGIVLLIGCLLAFKKRAGIVLLHAGIGLMMFSEFFVGQYAVEGRMSLSEGETVNYLRDIRSIELAVVDSTDEESDAVSVVPGSRLVPRKSRFSFGSKDQGVPLISDGQLPFDIQVEKFLKNASVQQIGEDDDNPATKGLGMQFIAKEARASSGTDGGEVDEAAAYIEFLEKESGESLGKYLLSQWGTNRDVAEEVEVDGKTYNVSLRYKRTYKPYSLSLKDVRKDDYLGTNTPMNYSSDVVLRAGDETVGDFKIWMNNPLRYAGETFYQSGYHSDRTGEHTVLQVVTNTGWMMPYVGCMLVAVGMLVHFSGTLWRFLSRLSLQADEVAVATPVWAYVVPAAIVLIFAGYVGSKFRSPTDTKANMRIHQFGQLPVVYQGRVKPLDTLARNTLRIVSNKETFDDESMRKSDSDRVPQLPAIRWMMDVMSESPDAEKHRVYRIDNLDVLATLGLNRRKGFRYSLAEFRDKIPELEKQLTEARAIPEEQLSFYHRKLFEVERRIRAVLLIQAAFGRVIPPFPTEEEFAEDREAVTKRLGMIQNIVSNLGQIEGQLARLQPPLSIPSGDADWEAFATAWNKAYVAQLPIPNKAEVPAGTLMWDSMLNAYAKNETKTFNDSLEEYQKLLADEPPPNFDQTKVGFEHFFNFAQPFKYSLVLYIVSFVLVAGAWVSVAFDKFRVLNRTAFWLLIFTFVLHSFALIARIYISGRPPVTNLYSSAVFIGWGAVALGLILELLHGRGGSKVSALGIGNAVAAIAGFSTLQIAYALAADGDTFTVLQAVLDTQFWLATHVVCITIGYLTTFVAGALGILYLATLAWRHPDYSKTMASMIYGTLCFAIFFSFVGTVLGGLWADDSWGRFWGWDPKENGALIIVLWNALILHARWGGMIRQKGLAVLAVIGNITTAWSWFGVNELGVGLHSYGFTEGVLRNLGVFIISQMVIIVLAGAAMYLWSDKPAASGAAK